MQCYGCAHYTESNIETWEEPDIADGINNNDIENK